MRVVTFQAPRAGPGRGEARPRARSRADDVVVAVEASGVCGSDLHIYHGRVPVEAGFTIGHEFVGTVSAAGDGGRARRGRRPRRRLLLHRLRHLHACLRGDYHRCRHGRTFGHGSHLGNLQGAQAERLLVPWANLTLRKVPDGLSADVALFAGDVMATGFHAIANGGMAAGDTVAVLGLGPVGLCAVQSALAGGATQVFAIDTVEERLAMARAVRRHADPPHRAGPQDARSGRRPAAPASTSPSTRSATPSRWRWRSASPATPAPSPGSAPTRAAARSRSASPGSSASTCASASPT